MSIIMSSRAVFRVKGSAFLDCKNETKNVETIFSER
jgi:hypothetical protein